MKTVVLWGVSGMIVLVLLSFLMQLDDRASLTSEPEVKTDVRSGNVSQTTQQQTANAGLPPNQNTLSSSSGVSAGEYTIEAFRFGYKPDTLTVKQGERVTITIVNKDTLHGLRIPDLGVSGETSVTFVADKTGTYKWFCNAFCGSGHRDMSGTLIVG